MLLKGQALAASRTLAIRLIRLRRGSHITAARENYASHPEVSDSDVSCERSPESTAGLNG